MHDFGLLTTMPQHLLRLRMKPDKLRALQRSRLRQMLRLAKKHSPFHRERLDGIDPDTFELDDLPRLPTMTKEDVLDNFDDLVTDPGLNLADAFAHLRKTDGDEMMLGRYKVVTSSGSSGRVGVWVFDQQGWRDLQAANMRMTFRDVLRHPLDMLHRPTFAVVAASSRSHLSIQTAHDFGGGWVEVKELPVTMAFPRLLEVLEASQPMSLSGYPSVLAELARASTQGRLSIHPRRVLCSAEPLLDEQRAVIESTWDVVVGNVWASSEAGPMAVGCFRESGMHLSEDQVLIEPVDAQGRPVIPGQTSAKVYVTNLFNQVMPLIRYELGDEITLMEQPCSCGSTLRRIQDIQGRFDELFDYGNGVKVHTYVIRKALYALESQMTDYQVFQTKRGVHVILRTTGGADVEPVRRKLEASLRQQGLASPEVTLDTNADLRRLPTGKLKRNVPLGFEGLQNGEAA